MEDFILEEQMERVVSPKTKEYLKEVVSCYRNGNYRASVAVLYTTVVFDLIQKIIVLKDIYNDKNAEKIYTEVEKVQKKNVNSPEWETKLIEKICDEMNIISSVEKEELLHLKKERNYAAHPIISGDNELSLKKIRKETAADLIRKAFEIVFLRDAILAKNINKEIVSDFKDYYKRVGEYGLEKYLKIKYFDRMTQERKDALYKYLHKEVFIKDDEDSNENRYLYFMAISALYREYPSNYNRLIKKNEDYFLNNIRGETFIDWLRNKKYSKIEEIVLVDFKYKSRIMNFIRFIEQNPEIYACLNKYSEQILESSIKKMYINNLNREDCLDRAQHVLELTAIFLSDNIEEHLKSMSNEDELLEEDLKLILKQVEYRGSVDIFKKRLIEYCVSGQSFIDAAKKFSEIEICKDYYDEQDYYYILKKMNINDQIYHNYYFSSKGNNKEGWIQKIIQNFKEKFNRELFNSNEEKKLYSNLCRNIQQINLGGNGNDFCENWDKDRMLDLIEERSSLYLDDELFKILCDMKINTPDNKRIGLWEYLREVKDKYPKISNRVFQSDDYNASAII